MKTIWVLAIMVMVTGVRGVDLDQEMNEFMKLWENFQLPSQRRRARDSEEQSAPPIVPIVPRGPKDIMEASKNSPESRSYPVQDGEQEGRSLGLGLGCGIGGGGAQIIPYLQSLAYQ